MKTNIRCDTKSERYHSLTTKQQRAYCFNWRPTRDSKTTTNQNKNNRYKRLLVGTVNKDTRE